MEVRSIGIVGDGQFGRFLARLAREHLHASVVVAPQGDDEALRAAAASDVVVLCVPISAYDSVAKAIASQIGERTIVCDIATVKMHTVKALRDAGITRFISTHPMFGPYSYEKHGKSLRGLRIALCETALDPGEREQVAAWLSSLGLAVLELSPEAHDKLIAETLFLTHLVGQVVHRGGFERTEIDTVSFGYLMDAVESVAHDEALFRDVFRYDPYCTDVLARFEQTRSDVVSGLERSGHDRGPIARGL